MIVQKISTEISATIYQSVGYGKKAKQTELVRFQIKPQFFAFDTESREALVYPVDFTVTFYPLERDQINSVNGAWPIEDLELLASGVDALVLSSHNMMMSDPSLSAVAKLTDDTMTIASCEEVSVSEGLFSGAEMRKVIFVNLRILGRFTDNVQWYQGMMDPLKNLAHEFDAQRLAFVEKVMCLTE